MAPQRIKFSSIDDYIASFPAGTREILDQPLPFDLICRIVKFRVEENKVK
jgi:hypothetical protein